jgi:hypothetical protein
MIGNPRGRRRSAEKSGTAGKVTPTPGDVVAMAKVQRLTEKQLAKRLPEVAAAVLQCLNSKEKLGARKVVNAVGPDGLPLYPLLKKDNDFSAVDSGLRKITKLEARRKWDLQSVQSTDTELHEQAMQIVVRSAAHLPQRKAERCG